MIATRGCSLIIGRSCAMRSALGKARRSTRKGTRSFYSFPRARDAVAATVEAHRGLESYQWPDGVTVRVRIGLHTGEPAMGEEGHTGLDVVRAARIAAVGRGGQVLLSETTRALIGSDLPDGVSARSIGAQRLKDIDRLEPLHELVMTGVSAALGLADPPSTEVSIGSDLAQMQERAADAVPPYGNLADTARQAIERRVLAELGACARGERALGPPSITAQKSSPVATANWLLVALVATAGLIALIRLVVRLF